MKCLIACFVEEAGICFDKKNNTSTKTFAKESPDDLTNNVLKMHKTLTEAKETPDRTYIPKRRV